ncbi:MAG: delta-60 repeat domain-containing protein [Anaerolineae bacterium]|nr:delta-60 repeat domain-containing protein [Anaerolineae bacterium]
MLKNLLTLTLSLSMLLPLNGASYANTPDKVWVLDRTFGKAGSAQVNIGQRPAIFMPAEVIALDSGKSIVVARVVDPPNDVATNYALIGLTGDGNLDLQFGVNGYIPFDPNGLYKVVVRNDVLYVIKKEILAFTLQGKPYPQFRQTHILPVTFPRASDIYPSTNGKWLLIADDNPTPILWHDSRPLVVRLNADGTPDPTFNDFKPSSLGYRQIEMRFLHADDQHIITEDADQIFVLSGSGKFIRALNKNNLANTGCPASVYPAPIATIQAGKYIIAKANCPHIGISRFDLSGNLDRSFGKQGHVALPDVKQIWRIPTTEGLIVQIGQSMFTKLDQIGQIDLNYGDNGITNIREHLRYFDWRIAVAPNHAINMVAASPTLSGTTVLLTHRLLPNGKSDETAGGSLAYTVNFWRDTRESPTHDLLAMPDGGWLMPIYDDYSMNSVYTSFYNLSPSNNVANIIVKVSANGNLDQAFGDQGIWRASPNQPIRKVLQQPDGKIIVIAKNWVVRLNTNGSSDPSFEPVALGPTIDENNTNASFVDATLTTNNELWLLVTMWRKALLDPNWGVQLHRFSSLGKALNPPNFNSNIHLVIGGMESLKIHMPPHNANQMPIRFYLQNGSHIRQYDLTETQINLDRLNIEREQVLAGFSDGIVSKHGDYFLLYKTGILEDSPCRSYWTQLTKINADYTIDYGFYSPQLLDRVIRQITQQPDNTYLITTQKRNSPCTAQYDTLVEEDITIMRMMSDGKIDAEFGGQGFYTVPGQQGFAQAAITLPNGDIVFNAKVKTGSTTNAAIFKLTTAPFNTAYAIKTYLPVGVR